MSGMYDGLDKFFVLIGWLSVICVPLCMWKLIDIIAWCLRHVEIAK